MSKQKVDLIIDLQYGSTGKGLIAGYMAETRCPDVVINANMPNAGHTYINSEGRKWIHKVLPNGIVSPNLKKVMIGPGSVFDTKRLVEELLDSVDLLSADGVEILIHPNAVPLSPEHKIMEQGSSNRRSIGSTRQGSAEAMVHKIDRPVDEDVIARDCSLLHNALAALSNESSIDIRVCDHHDWRSALIGAKYILAEGAQGYSLGINSQFYPYCTSRDCGPSRFLSDMGIPHKMLRYVIGSMRVHPIRVAGTSGDCYPDQKETTWEAIGQTPELTTVTKLVRRVFTYSEQQIQDALFDCQPDIVFLNFCNYDVDMAEEVADHILWYSSAVDQPIDRIIYGHGPTFDDVQE